MSRRIPAGFTLLELVVVLVIVAALVGAASTAVGDGLEAARAADARARLLASLSLAAHRAALTGYHGVACSSVDGASCAGSVDWTSGWIVFVDADGDGVRDAGEAQLAAVPALAGQVRLRSTVGRTRVVFQGNGGNAGSNVTYTMCDGRGPAQARALVISNTGRMRDAPADAASAAAKRQTLCRKDRRCGATMTVVGAR